jgi:hypothetical protein
MSADAVDAAASGLLPVTVAPCPKPRVQTMDGSCRTPAREVSREQRGQNGALPHTTPPLPTWQLEWGKRVFGEQDRTAGGEVAKLTWLDGC